MHGTNAGRMARLVGHLATHPFTVPRYLGKSVLRKRSPLDLELPWISWGAIDFLEGYLKPSMTVFEWGGGGSTLFFAARVKRVITVEDHAEWCQRIRERLAQKGLTNVELRHLPFDFSHPELLTQSEYYSALPDGECDVILVDGQEHENKPVRPTCFALAESRIKPGGLILVDDSWRYPELRTHNRAKSHRVFQSVGPARLGVTSTDLFFY